jgi:hypothetical protein
MFKIKIRNLWYHGTRITMLKVFLMDFEALQNIFSFFLKRFIDIFEFYISQRYFLSSDEYRSGGPVLLFLWGEGMMDSNWVANGFLGELAATLGALTIHLEHRFYGKSRPTV